MYMFPYLFSFLHCWIVSSVASKKTPEASAVACFSLGWTTKGAGKTIQQNVTTIIVITQQGV